MLRSDTPRHLWRNETLPATRDLVPLQEGKVNEPTEDHIMEVETFDHTEEDKIAIPSRSIQVNQILQYVHPHGCVPGIPHGGTTAAEGYLLVCCWHRTCTMHVRLVGHLHTGV